MFFMEILQRNFKNQSDSCRTVWSILQIEVEKVRLEGEQKRTMLKRVPFFTPFKLLSESVKYHHAVERIMQLTTLLTAKANQLCMPLIALSGDCRVPIMMRSAHADKKRETNKHTQLAMAQCFLTRRKIVFDSILYSPTRTLNDGSKRAPKHIASTRLHLIHHVVVFFLVLFSVYSVTASRSFIA